MCLNSLLGDKNRPDSNEATAVHLLKPVRLTASQRPAKGGNNHISISQLSFTQSFDNLCELQSLWKNNGIIKGAGLNPIRPNDQKE